MTTIVLMGDVSPKQSKGKTKEGEFAIVSIKVGRYAVLLEFLKAFEEVDERAASGSRLRTFVETVETRLTAMLEIEVWPLACASLTKQEKETRLPSWYRSLICQLLLNMRLVTQSMRR